MSFFLLSVFSKCAYAEVGIRCLINGFFTHAEASYIPLENAAMRLNGVKYSLGEFILKQVQKKILVEVVHISPSDSIESSKRNIRNFIVDSHVKETFRYVLEKLTFEEKVVFNHLINGFTPTEISSIVGLHILKVHCIKREILNALNVNSSANLDVAFKKMLIIVFD